MNRRSRLLAAATTLGGCTAVALAACSAPGSTGSPRAAVSGAAAVPAAAADGGVVSATGGAAATGGGAAAGASANGAGGSAAGGNGIASTALRWPPSLLGQIGRWKAGPGGAAWSAVTALVGVPAQTAAVRQYPETTQACRSLGSSVSTALSAPPIPYAPMQRAYATSLTELAQAATDCRAAISVHQDGEETVAVHMDAALLQRALAELTAGSKTLYTATAEIRTLRS